MFKFNYSFYIYISDYYTNHGKWRHVFHKGTEITEIDTHEWEKVMTMCPDQGVGVWLAPFNNNLRVCITTRTNNVKNDFKPHKHPFEEKYEDSEYDLTVDELETADWRKELLTSQSYYEGFWVKIAVLNKTNNEILGIQHNWNFEKS